MVAAKLDQSRVLVTKFRQNRLALKGRSAGQRHTDRQTNSAENNGPSGLQAGQQTDNATRSVTTGRIYVRSTAMRPNNNNSLIYAFLLCCKFITLEAMNYHSFNFLAASQYSVLGYGSSTAWHRGAAPATNVLVPSHASCHGQRAVKGLLLFFNLWPLLAFTNTGTVLKCH